VLPDVISQCLSFCYHKSGTHADQHRVYVVEVAAVLMAMARWSLSRVLVSLFNTLSTVCPNAPIRPSVFRRDFDLVTDLLAGPFFTPYLSKAERDTVTLIQSDPLPLVSQHGDVEYVSLQALAEMVNTTEDNVIFIDTE
ncbi:hypothetical protein KIPB_012598, partial [Kipferlia bialata]